MNNRPYIYKTDRPEYNFGYLELKPYTNPSMGKRHSAATKIIEQSRVPVSEELFENYFRNIDTYIVCDHYEGEQFDIINGQAVTTKVKVSRILTIGSKIDEQGFKLMVSKEDYDRLQSENEKLKEIIDFCEEQLKDEEAVYQSDFIEKLKFKIEKFKTL